MDFDLFFCNFLALSFKTTKLSNALFSWFNSGTFRIPIQYSFPKNFRLKNSERFRFECKIIDESGMGKKIFCFFVTYCVQFVVILIDAKHYSFCFAYQYGLWGHWRINGIWNLGKFWYFDVSRKKNSWKFVYVFELLSFWRIFW